MGAKAIMEFTKRHPNTQVSFKYNVDSDSYSVSIRDFNTNQAFKQVFHGIEFEDMTDRVIEYSLRVVEQEMYR